VLTKVKVLGQGEFFGEMALLNNKPRLASVFCEEDCEFGVLDKESFNSILKE
jgi:CRP-like cAMP-binding protein